jgi:hypothetical protein
MIRSKLYKTALGACVAALAVAGVAVAAAITLKRYDFDGRNDVANMRHTNGKDCTKSHAGGRAFGITVGRDTVECTYRTTVAGPTLDIAATGRLLSATPADARNSIFLSVSLRHGPASEYELAVFPKRQEFRVYRRQKSPCPGDECRTLEAHQERPALINGVGEKNRLRLRVFAADGGPAELKMFVNGKRVASGVNPNLTNMEGQNSTVSIARAFQSNESIRGAKATFDSIVLKTRNPIG